MSAPRLLPRRAGSAVALSACPSPSRLPAVAADDANIFTAFFQCDGRSQPGPCQFERCRNRKALERLLYLTGTLSSTPFAQTRVFSHVQPGGKV